MLNHYLSKKIYTIITAFVLGLFATGISFASTVDFLEAENYAKNKLVQLDKDKDFIIQSHEIIKENNIETAYIFNLKPRGFIIVSAEVKKLILAYSFDNNYFLSSKKQNPFEQHSTIPDKYENAKGDSPLTPGEEFQQWPQDGYTSTGGWLNENWHQDAPYNAYCPQDPDYDTRCLAGSPAVAMAQILNYYKCTNNTSFNSDDSYENEEGSEYEFEFDEDHLLFLFPSFDELNNYLLALCQKYTNNTALDDNDKAALVFACGMALKQNYGQTDLAKYIDAEQTYEAYQRFSCSHADYYNMYYKNIYSLLKDAMKAGHPAHIVLRNQDHEEGSHVVVDGYNTDGYYHINFCNGGEGNGWFLLETNMPEEISYLEGSILNIIDKPLSVDEFVKGASSGLAYPNPFSESTKIEFNAPAYSNMKLQIFDATGNIVKSLNAASEAYTWDGTDNSGKLLATGTYICRLIANGKMLGTTKVILNR